MRILELHCDYFSYKTEKKALKSVGELKEEEKAGRVENVLVVFTSIEEGDTAQVAKKAALEIKKNFLEVGAKTILLHPYAHLSSKLARPTEAVYMLNELYLEIKNFAPDAHKSPFGYYKSFEMRCKGHPLAELSKTITSENLDRSLEKIGKDAVLEVAIARGNEDKEVISESLKTEAGMKSHFHILGLDGELHDVEKFDFGKFKNLASFAEY
ncbi:MAG: threonyl-tRNA synthetase editing domain-containing protein [Candidatus Micrarchaeota archaeon]